jgi:dolichyl-phosphate-mannose--protein O-mannosyl transferase
LKKWLIIGGVVFAVLIIALIVLISVNNAWATARDVSVVILAIFSMISTLLTIALLAVLIYVVMALRTVATETVMPKVSQTLDQVKDTAVTAKNTSTYVAQGVVTPLIKISSVAAGVKAAAVALARRTPPDRFEP